jgi:hypothetical protein
VCDAEQFCFGLCGTAEGWGNPPKLSLSSSNSPSSRLRFSIALACGRRGRPWPTGFDPGCWNSPIPPGTWRPSRGTSATRVHPFRYDPERRFQLRCELDAAFFLLYLGTPEEWEREATPELKALFPTPRDAVAYILDQFPIVRRRDEERYGRYRTKETTLAVYDELTKRSRRG